MPSVVDFYLVINAITWAQTNVNEVYQIYLIDIIGKLGVFSLPTYQNKYQHPNYDVTVTSYSFPSP